MKSKNIFGRLSLVSILATAMLFVSLPGQAAMVGTAQINRDISGNSVDQITLLQGRLWIQQQLVMNGVDEADSVIRVSRLSDAQVQQVRVRFDEMPAGAGVVGVAATIAVVILVTDLIGLTDIYPFIRPIK
ncbi:MAG: hypothetical protein ACI9KN_000750 [Gammaproteobacteria bacterium]|jgi:hypothetical protein